jgi:ABC-type polysaccharide/polyol phosphate export permease
MRNFLMPVSKIYFVLGLFITNLIVVIFQVGIFLTVGYLKFGVDVVSNLWQISYVMLMLASIFILMGMLFGYLIRSQQTSILVNTFTLLGVFLFSDIIFPLESMPKAAAYLAGFNPIVIAESMLREILFYSVPLGLMADKIFILLCFIVALFSAVLITGSMRRN